MAEKVFGGSAAHVQFERLEARKREGEGQEHWTLLGSDSPEFLGFQPFSGERDNLRRHWWSGWIQGQSPAVNIYSRVRVDGHS